MKSKLIAGIVSLSILGGIALPLANNAMAAAKTSVTYGTAKDINLDLTANNAIDLEKLANNEELINNYGKVVSINSGGTCFQFTNFWWTVGCGNNINNDNSNNGQAEPEDNQDDTSNNENSSNNNSGSGSDDLGSGDTGNTENGNNEGTVTPPEVENPVIPPTNEDTGETTPPTTPDNDQSQVVDSNFMSQVEQKIYEIVNVERAKAGVASLSYSNTMQKYARIKSQDMGDKNYFSHEDLSGNLITTQMKNDGVSYSAWGENIAYISGTTDANALATQFMNNWMNSDGHRKNILSTNFTGIGVGVYKVGNKVYATQEFYR